MTYFDDLNNKSTSLFIDTEEQFCRDVSLILNDHRDKFQGYENCNIDTFSNGGDLRVNFSLEFRDFEGRTRGEIARLVVAMVKENANRTVLTVNSRDLTVLKIGTLLISVDGITYQYDELATTPSPYDGIAYTYSFPLYDGNVAQGLQDNTSTLFLETAITFCKYVDNLFANVGRRSIIRRYYGCRVEEIRSDGRLVFTVALRDIDVVIVRSMLNMVALHTEQVSIGGQSFLPLGGLYVKATEEPSWVLIMLRDFMTNMPPVTTTPAPTRYGVTLTMGIYDPVLWTAPLGNVSSNYYKAYAEPFCRAVSKVMTDKRNSWKKEFFVGCENVVFNREPFRISADLLFLGPPAATEELIIAVQEFSSRQYLEDSFTLRLGKMLVYYAGELITFKRWNVVLSTTTATTTTTPTTTTTTSTASTTRANSTPSTSNPCKGIADGTKVAHPTSCNKFIVCVGGGSGFTIPCGDLIFEDKTCKTPPSGFVCDRGP